MKNRKLTKEDYELCDKITTRAIGCGLYEPNRRITCIMDVTNAAQHFNMRLKEWLEADLFDFAHDILGVANAIDRTSTPVSFSNDPCFVPRFAGNYN